MQRQRRFLLRYKILFLFLFLGGGIAIYGLYHKKSHVKKMPQDQLSTVSVAAAQSADVPVYLLALGTVIPTQTVTVKTQVNGQLLKVFFKEGQSIAAGKLLAQIDPQIFEAQLKQYEGQLAKDKALLVNARLDLKRFEKLWTEDAVSKQTLDTQRSLVTQLEGTVKSDQGLVETAKVNIGFSKIKAPISGRLGLRLVDPGNYVQTSDTNGLFVINTLQPINVLFTLAEDNIPQVVKQMKMQKKLLVQAFDRTQNNLLATGSLLTIDNQIDPTTGTIKLKAQFKNSDDTLFPNQFVNIRLQVDQLPNATVIPSQAILRGTNGSYVYRYHDQNQTVTITPIVVGVTIKDNTVVKSGILPGEMVITEGTDKLTDGAKVKVAHVDTPAFSPKHPHGLQ